MTRFFLYSLLALAAGAALALLLTEDPGYVLVYVRGYTVEATLATVFFSLLICIVVLTGLFWLLQLINPIKLFRRNTWRKLFSWGSPTQASANGLQLLLLGHWQDAYKLLVENAERMDNPAFNYLAASLAAFQRDDRISWSYCLDQAEKKSPDGNAGIKSLRGFLEARSGQLEQGLTILLALQRVAPGSPFVLAQIKDIYVKLPDWENLALLMPELEKYKVVSAAEAQHLSEQIYRYRLGQAARRGLDDLRQVWNDLPKNLRGDERLIAFYLQQLLRFGQDAEAAAILARQLKSRWSDNLVGMLGHLKSGNPQQHLLQLESLLKEHPDDAVLLLTLGRLSLRNHLWGKAKDYFAQAAQASHSPVLTAEINAELGRLLDKLGEHEKSLACYQRAMGLMDHKLPELPMPVVGAVTPLALVSHLDNKQDADPNGLYVHVDL